VRKKKSGTGPGVSWTLVLAIASIVALVIAYRMSSEDSTIRRVVREAPEVATALPERAEKLQQGLSERVRQARDAFQRARTDSEQSLLAQLSVAKQNGAQPPI
jgi:Flp pilus assembly protein TadB